MLEPVAVYLMILERQYRDGSFAGSYNVGPDFSDCVRTGELTQLFADAWGSGFRYEVHPDGGPHEAGFLKLDCTKLKQTFGWEPKWNIGEAVQKTAEWSKAYLAGEEMQEITDRQIREFF